MNRCTISLHQFESDIEHIDIFFEIGDSLETYEISKEEFQLLNEKNKILCNKKKPHRKVYLDFEGEISNSRGYLTMLWKGYYRNEKNIFPEELNILLVDNLNLEIEPSFESSLRVK